MIEYEEDEYGGTVPLEITEGVFMLCMFLSDKLLDKRHTADEIVDLIQEVISENGSDKQPSLLN